jgi:putative transposase
MAKRALIEPDHPSIPVSRQCGLLSISRSGYYYQPDGENQENIRMMHRIDELFTKYPFYGVKKMTAHLRRLGDPVNVKRVRRLRGKWDWRQFIRNRN